MPSSSAVNASEATGPWAAYVPSDQAPWKPRRGIAGDIDKEVHIAFRRVFPASHRAEKQDIARAVVGSQPQDFVSMFSYALTGAHSSIIVPSARRL